MPSKPSLARLTAHADTLTQTGNFIALVLAWNAPFYPLYVWLIAGNAAFPSVLLSACSLPVFAAVPVLARHSGLAGRVMLCLAGTANTVFCTWLMGPDAGVALFLLPCIMLAALVFHPAEWRFGLALVALPMLAGWFLPGRMPRPPHLYTATQYAHLLNMNAASVAVLTAFFGYLFTRARQPQ